jgi:hypothetical protein
MRWLILGTAALVLVTSGGCSKPRGRVHGTVRYQGKPLAGATVIFLASDNQVYPVRIQPDGSYQSPSLPQGHILVSIQVEEPRPAPRPQPGAKGNDPFAKGEAMTDDEAKRGGGPARPATPAVTIPPRYADPNNSGLGFDLTGPDQEHPIDLD